MMSYRLRAGVFHIGDSLTCSSLSVEYRAPVRGKAQATRGRLGPPRVKAKRATSARRLPEPCLLVARKASGLRPELQGRINRTR